MITDCKININKLLSVLLVAASEGLWYCHFDLSREIPREVIVLMDHRDTIVIYCSRQDILQLTLILFRRSRSNCEVSLV